MKIEHVLTECEADPDLFVALFAVPPAPEPAPIDDALELELEPALEPALVAEIVPASTPRVGGPVEGFSPLQRFRNFAGIANESNEHRVDLDDHDVDALGELLDMLRGRVSFHDVFALGYRLDGADVGAIRDHLAAMRAREDELSEDERAAMGEIISAIESISAAAFR